MEWEVTESCTIRRMHTRFSRGGPATGGGDLFSAIGTIPTVYSLFFLQLKNGGFVSS